MEAVAQDFGDPVTQVGVSLANQYTMLAAIILVLGIGLYFLPTFLKRLKEATNGHSKEEGHGGLRDYLDAKFTDVGHQLGAIREDVSEMKTDFKAHAENDRESFRELYARSEPRQPWSQEERQRRAARS